MKHSRGTVTGPGVLPSTVGVALVLMLHCILYAELEERSGPTPDTKRRKQAGWLPGKVGLSCPYVSKGFIATFKNMQVLCVNPKF